MTEAEAIALHMKKFPALAGAYIACAANVAKSDGPIMVVCSDSHAGIVGMKQSRCGCGALIWISPSTQKLIASHDVVDLVCHSCAEKLFGGGALP